MPKVENLHQFINPRTRTFLVRAIEEGAHLKQPPNLSSQDWVLMRNVAGSYLVSPARLADIGEVYAATRKTGGAHALKSLTGDAIGHRVISYLRYLHSNCSMELQMQYSLKTLPLDKKSSTYYRLKMSERKGGLGMQIANQLARGKHIKTVLRQYNLDAKSKGSDRSRFREMGINIPLKGNRSAGELEKTEGPFRKVAASDSSIQRALDSLSMAQVHKLSRYEPPVVTTVHKLARESGYSFPYRTASGLFVNRLVDEKIPLAVKENTVKSGSQEGKVQRWYVVWAKHSNRIRQAFTDASELDRYKKADQVVIVCGPPRPLPPAYIINQERKRIGYKSVTRGMKSFGVHRQWGQEISVEDFLGTDCPATVLKAYDTYYYHESEESTFKNHALARDKILTRA